MKKYICDACPECELWDDDYGCQQEEKGGECPTLETPSINQNPVREILFRGKRVSDGEWLYGSLLTDNRGQKHIIPFKEIYMDGHHVCIESDWPQFFDQQTIGQFTGLIDQNGKKIFEGDIYVTDYNQRTLKNNVQVLSVGGAFCGGKTCLRCSPLAWDSEEDNEELYLDEEFLNHVVVVGNIHDNPELVEVTE